MNFPSALQIIRQKGVTAYELASATGLNESGLRRILDGEVENPRRTTKEKIILYVEGMSTVQDDTLNKVCLIKGDLEVTIQEIALFVAKNEEEVFQDRVMNNIVEKRVAKRLVDITSSPEKLKEFLNS